MKKKVIKKVQIVVPAHVCQNCVWELSDITLPAAPSQPHTVGGGPSKDGGYKTIAHKKIKISGPLGAQSMVIPNTINVAISIEKQHISIILSPPKGQSTTFATLSDGGSSEFLKLNASLIQQMIVGVTEGFKKQIKLIGIGYKIQPTPPMGPGDQTSLTLNIGFSHPVVMPLSAGISISDLALKENKTDPSTLVLNSTSLKELNNFVDSIHRIRPIEKSFKGTGITTNTPI